MCVRDLSLGRTVTIKISYNFVSSVYPIGANAHPYYAGFHTKSQSKIINLIKKLQSVLVHLY